MKKSESFRKFVVDNVPEDEIHIAIQIKNHGAVCS